MDLTLATRLLCASTQAYVINSTGPARPTLPPPVPPRSLRIGFVDAPLGYATGLDRINAALIGMADDGLIVAFRGTLPLTGPDIARSVLDWIADVDAPLVNDADFPGQVHQGFRDALQELWPDVGPAITAAAQADKPIFVTGHSKGGALANLAAMRIHAALPAAQIVVCTFAAARSGDAAYAAAYANQIPDSTRYEYPDDLVPHLPPTLPGVQILDRIPFVDGLLRDLAVGYVSVGRLQFIDTKGVVHDDFAGLEVRRLEHLAELMLTLQFQLIADDHSISYGSGYAQAIGPGV